MTYADLFNAMRERCPRMSFSIEVTTWHHGSGDPETRWSIYAFGTHYTCPNPEDALAAFDLENGEQKSETIERVSERMGDVL